MYSVIVAKWIIVYSVIRFSKKAQKITRYLAFYSIHLTGLTLIKPRSFFAFVFGFLFCGKTHGAIGGCGYFLRVLSFLNNFLSTKFATIYVTPSTIIGNIPIKAGDSESLGMNFNININIKIHPIYIPTNIK